MTLAELLGGAGGVIAAGLASYRLVMGKVEGILGKKEPGQDSLRDVVMRIEGKVDAQREHTSEQLSLLSDRVGRLEDRVFTPPARRALRSHPGGE